MSSVLPFVTWSDSSRKEISGATSGECRMCFLLENLEYVFPKIPFLLSVGVFLQCNGGTLPALR